MGGTGLEPVTPSLSSRGDRSLGCDQVRFARLIKAVSDFETNTRERERTQTVAIVATSG
jgi:hypothetical protein